MKGLWGRKSLSLKFDEHVNFLTGLNGSGKTTVINLIAATLGADFATLDRISFESIDIEVCDPQKKANRSTITVQKRRSQKSEFLSIEYEITGNTKAETYRFSVDSVPEPLMLRESVNYQRDARNLYVRQRLSRGSETVLEKLRQQINLTWLSIHRMQVNRNPREERDRGYESPVDQRLYHLSNELVKYFSSLAIRADAETNKFQRFVFLSLLGRESPDELVDSVQKLDLAQERNTLTAIFKTFQLSEPEFQPDLEGHLKIAKAAIASVQKQKSLTFPQWIGLINLWRSHSVVQQWHALDVRQQVIYEPKVTFLSVLNGMIGQKRFSISEKNELAVELADGTPLPLTGLSSGEKQLLIILGEALLQERQRWVYIADEPELSLHVSWQEQLIPHLKKINPSAQVVFATHSPDIVSVFTHNVFDVGVLLK